jgi:putative transposase
MDVASRVVTGLHVSLDAPSVISVGMALRHAILPKTEALTERGVVAD